MTRKQYEQKQNNAACEEAIGIYNSMVNTHQAHHLERLHHCNAYMFIRGDWVVLKSYDTLVALFDTKSGILYDILRLVYGYTATSAQHIAKFRNLVREEYGFQCGGLHTVTWREV